MDACHLAGSGHRVVAERLVESHDVPPLFAAGPVTSLFLALAEGSGVPSGVPGLDSETDLGPRDVEVDRLTVRKVDPMLANRCRESDVFEALDDQLFESALRRPRLIGHAVEPLFEHCNAVLASTSVLLEVVGSFMRSDQPKIPCVLCGTGEPMRVQCGRESEEHPQWCGDHEPVRSSISVAFIEPRRSGDGRPGRDTAS